MNDEQQEQMSSLVSTLKHDLNNALSGVQTALEIMGMDEVFCDSELGEELSGVILASKKVRWLIEDLTLISTPKVESCESGQRCSIDEVLELLGAFSESQALEWTTEKSPVLHLAGPAQSNARSLYYGLLARSVHQRQRGNFVFRQKGEGVEVELSFESEASLASGCDSIASEDDRALLYQGLSRLWISSLGGHLHVQGDQPQLRWSLKAWTS